MFNFKYYTEEDVPLVCEFCGEDRKDYYPRFAHALYKRHISCTCMRFCCLANKEIAYIERCTSEFIMSCYCDLSNPELEFYYKNYNKRYPIKNELLDPDNLPLFYSNVDFVKFCKNYLLLA